MGFIRGIEAGELWWEPVTGATGAFLRLEERTGLTGVLVGRGGMIHGASLPNSEKNARRKAGCVDWH